MRDNGKGDVLARKVLHVIDSFQSSLTEFQTCKTEIKRDACVGSTSIFYQWDPFI